MGVQHFNFAPKFPQNAFLDENFPTRTKFSDSPKFRGERSRHYLHAFLVETVTSNLYKFIKIMTFIYTSAN